MKYLAVVVFAGCATVQRPQPSLQLPLRMWRLLCVVMSVGCSPGRASISVDTTRLDFGSVSACHIATRSFSIRNDAAEAVTLTLADVDDFTVVPSGELTIEPGGTQIIEVSFDGAQVNESREVTLVIRHLDEVVAQVTLAARWTGYSFALSFYFFGEVAVGDALLSAPLDIPATAFDTLAEPGFFIDLSNPPRLRFSPTEERSYSARVTVPEENECPGYASFTGVGVTALRANLLRLVSDGGVADGTVTFVNRATREVQLTDLDAGDEFVLAATSLTVPPALRERGLLMPSNATLDVRWTPRDGGTTTGTLTMTTDLARQPTFSVAIHGTAP